MRERARPVATGAVSIRANEHGLQLQSADTAPFTEIVSVIDAHAGRHEVIIMIMYSGSRQARIEWVVYLLLVQTLLLPQLFLGAQLGFTGRRRRRNLVKSVFL